MCGLCQLHCEHDVLEVILDRLDVAVGPLAVGEVPDAAALSELSNLLQAIVSFDENHCARTEGAILPSLQERYIDVEGTPLSMVCYDHMCLRVLINKMRRRLTRINSNAICREEFALLALAYSKRMRAHMKGVDNQLAQLNCQVLTVEDSASIDNAMERYDCEHNRDGMAQVVELAAQIRS